MANTREKLRQFVDDVDDDNKAKRYLRAVVEVVNQECGEETAAEALSRMRDLQQDFRRKDMDWVALG